MSTLQTPRLIVFHSIRYRESDLLVYAYTQPYGRQAFLLRHKRGLAALIFPLSILETETYYKPGGTIQNIKSIYPATDLSGIRTDLYKSAVALFLGEILYKCIKEEDANLPLFRFLVESIQTLNDLKSDVSNFHLYFLTTLCTYLGFAPSPNFHPEHTPLFDTAQGLFVPADTISDFLFSKENSRLFAQLANPSIDHIHKMRLNGLQRHSFVMQMIQYLRYHLGIPLEIKSPEVLRQLFQ